MLTTDDAGVISPGAIPVFNPATGEQIGHCPSASRADVDRAVAGARAAFVEWRRDEDLRRERLRVCGALVERSAHELAVLMTREQGKPLAESSAEVALAAEWFRTVSELPLDCQVLPAATGLGVRVQNEPFGVVGAITPWNFPVILAVVKIAPALLAGNTVVLKPSPIAPLTALAMVRLLADELPSGVLSSVAGDSDVGRALVEHEGVDLVTFTGSAPVGREIAANAGRGLKKTVLELGGNDAAIVLPGTDPGAVAEPLYRAAFTNAGQFCVAVKRLFVHHSLAAELVEALAELTTVAVVGNGLDPATTLGPVTTPEQRDRLLAMVAEARERGARVVSGGCALPGPGYFLPPTLVTGVPDGAALVADEQFGPVLPILEYDDVSEAVGRANATRFGLGGSVWGNDAYEAAHVAASLECGTTWVNQHAAFHPLAPFGGHKWSGIGCEYGPGGLAEFLRYRVRYEPAP